MTPLDPKLFHTVFFSSVNTNRDWKRISHFFLDHCLIFWCKIAPNSRAISLKNESANQTSIGMQAIAIYGIMALGI